MNCIESFRQYVDGFPPSFTVSEINLSERDRKVQISKILKILLFIQFECSICKMFILKWYWWAIWMCDFIPKRETNSGVLPFDRTYSIFIFNQFLFFISLNFVVDGFVLSAFGNMSTAPSVFCWVVTIAHLTLSLTQRVRWAKNVSANQRPGCTWPSWISNRSGKKQHFTSILTRTFMVCLVSGNTVVLD